MDYEYLKEKFENCLMGAFLDPRNPSGSAKFGIENSQWTKDVCSALVNEVKHMNNC